MPSSRSKTDKDKAVTPPSPAAKEQASATSAITTMEQLLGPQLLQSVSKSVSTNTLLKDTKLVALYFSAAWCPPCQKFSPILKEFYKHTSRNDIEIIYVSSDKSLDEFNTYYGSMPWLAMMTDKEAAKRKNDLGRALKLAGIPTLVVLEVETGYFVTNQARQQVYEASSDEDECRKLVHSWIQQGGVPIEDAAVDESQNLFVKILLAIAKNPMYMFGMLYIFKQFLRYLKGNNELPEVDTPPLGRDVQDEF
jgi:nucleoredoxin